MPPAPSTTLTPPSTAAPYGGMAESDVAARRGGTGAPGQLFSKPPVSLHAHGDVPAAPRAQPMSALFTGSEALLKAGSLLNDGLGGIRAAFEQVRLVHASLVRPVRAAD